MLRSLKEGLPVEAVAVLVLDRDRPGTSAPLSLGTHQSPSRFDQTGP